MIIKSGKLLILFAMFVVNAYAQVINAGTVEGLPSVSIKDGKLFNGEKVEQFIRNIEHELGITMVWAAYPTMRLLSLTAMGKIDVIFPMGFSAQRDSLLQRSEPVYISHDCFVTKNLKVNNHDKSMVVGCKLGSPQETYLTTHGYKINPTNSYEGLFEMLIQGRVPIIAIPINVYDELIPKYAHADLNSEVYLTREIGFYYSPNFSKAKEIDRAIKKYNGIFQ